MGSSTLQSRLKALKPSTPARSLTPLLPLIFEKIDEGVSLKEIYKLLSEEGFSINENTFKSFIRRNRIKREQTLNSARDECETQIKNSENDLDSTKPGNDTLSKGMSISDALDPKVREELGSKYLKKRRKPKEGL